MGIISFIEKVCVQTAVYWAPATKDGYNQTAFSTGVDVLVRWDDSTEKITNSRGKEIVSNAELMVPQSYGVEDEGYFYLGSLADLSAEQQANPKKVNESYPIQKIEKNPLFKSTDDFVYTIYL